MGLRSWYHVQMFEAVLAREESFTSIEEQVIRILNTCCCGQSHGCLDVLARRAPTRSSPTFDPCERNLHKCLFETRELHPVQ